MAVRKAASWIGRKSARLRLLFMLYFMFDRVMQEENLKWQQKDRKNKAG